MKTEKLTPKQMKFAEYYAASGLAKQSAVKAGYSANYAGQCSTKLLKNPKVVGYISSVTEPERNLRIMNAEERQAVLSDIIRDPESSTNDRIKAIDKLNKMTGVYAAKNLTAAVPVIITGEEKLLE